MLIVSVGIKRYVSSFCMSGFFSVVIAISARSIGSTRNDFITLSDDVMFCVWVRPSIAPSVNSVIASFSCGVIFCSVDFIFGFVDIQINNSIANCSSSRFVGIESTVSFIR